MDKQTVRQWIRKFKATQKKAREGPGVTYKKMNYYICAKNYETKERNLKKALEYYTIAAQKGERYNSCIKDFSSVIHQLGHTEQAILFLQSMKEFYDGDIRKYESLLQNFKHQLRPSGKHYYRFLLIDIINITNSNNEKLIPSMFTSTSRIKKIRTSQELDFKQCQSGRYILLEFESFSGAKKTLQSFILDEWLASIFWVNINQIIVCEAVDGQIEFDLQDQDMKELALLNSEKFSLEGKQSEKKLLNEERIFQIQSRRKLKCEKIIQDTEDICHF